MGKVNPIQFLKQVKQEVKKVAWPTRKETSQTLVMVLIIVALASTFFFFVDQVLGWLVRAIINFGG